MLSPRPDRIAALRHKVDAWLDSGSVTDPVAVGLHRLLVALVIASVTCVVLESVPEYVQRYGALFDIVEAVAIVAFTLEYVLRLWSAPAHTLYADLPPAKAALAFARTPSALIDLLSILPFYLSLFVPADLRILLLLRLLRFFKLARYSPGMRSLVAALEAEQKALLASAIILFGVVLIAASAMHLVEHDAQPDKFGTIPSSMWWAVVTLTTVGYGDVVPFTLAGRIVASFTMVMGLMMLALPIGIIANAFAEQIHRREFVITWGMLARVPLFASLSASEIADLMRYLRAQTVPAEAVIVRRGDFGDCMYFIAQGQVEVELPNGPRLLGEGQFFGEMALLGKRRRSAAIRAKVPTKLLVLDATDLQALMERNGEVRERIEATMRERLAQSALADQEQAPDHWS